ncbi:MAG: hypothetical protein NTU79_06850 [Planctomycetota bacterium]|nr:hypothetical protein [Planctomycetota bacterium]
MFTNTFTLCLCVFALSSSKGTNTAEEYVDLIELNHFYDHQGRHVYDQVIFYEQSPETGRFQVRAWCLIEDRDNLSRRPVKNVETQRYQVDWFDNDQRLVRKITSRSFRESWTQIDPERANKKILEERSRIALVQNPKKFLADKQTRQADETKQTTAEASVQGNINTANIQLNVPVPTQGAGAGASTVPIADALVLR